LGHLHPADRSTSPRLFQEGVQACVKNVLAHVRVLDPNVPLEKLGEPTDDENYLESIERAEPEFESLASHIAKKVEIWILCSNDEANI
jgi:hypothetical protein